jgi:benzoyl-CoA reductase/2-hydroxyglutaryl-CoA dehydratase subunit BcrC/BadD/HgdB
VTRREHIHEQRDRHGRKAVAVLPVHYPKELLTALDVLAVELWGPPGPPRGDDAGRVQAYVCPVVRNALAFLASGGADAVDGVLFPHTCDSVQQLATLAPDFGGWQKPAFTFQHPRGPPRPSARAFLDGELRALVRELEAFTGRALDGDRLAAAVKLHDEIDELRGALLDAGPRLTMSDGERYALLRRGEWLWPGEHLAELRAALGAIGTIGAASSRPGVPVLVTGYVPEPMGLFDVLAQAGAFVAADDYAGVGRRVVRERGAGAAGWERVLERYWSAPPCPTRSSDQPARMQHLVRLAERSGARGVIVHGVKFCEPELFDVPAIRATFAARSLPVLQLDGELERELSAQAVTRIEAFVEMLSSGRAA